MKSALIALSGLLPTLVLAVASSSLPTPISIASSSVAAARGLPPSSSSLHRRRHRSGIPASSPGWNMRRSLSIRGGGLGIGLDSDDDEDYSSSEEDDYSSEEEDELSDGELSNLEVSEPDDDDEESEVEEEENEEEEEQPQQQPSAASGPPVKLRVRTALASGLIDQHLEFAASRKRTVLSLRQAISRTMRGRPPLSCVVLKHNGRLLDDDDETVDDILADVDEDDDDEDEESDSEDDSIGEEEDSIKLSLTADMIPPVDAKFGIELREKVAKMSTREIVEAYCANMAGMAYGQEMQAKECESYDRREERLLKQRDGGHGEYDDDDEGDEEEEDEFSATSGSANRSLDIRRRAAQIRSQFEGTMSDETLQLMHEEDERVKATLDGGEGENEEEVVYGLASQGGSTAASRNARRGRTPRKGGAATNVRRSLQRNLNVDWSDTLRNSLLFLFFGYFGGRGSFSRTFLLMSSPLCFLIQTRPVKVAMKQLFYTVGEPPGILLSLLPAPQQAIMGLDYGDTMRGLYGEKALLAGQEEWMELEQRAGSDDGGLIGGGLEFDSDVDDEEDDAYDESDYDSDDGEY